MATKKKKIKNIFQNANGVGWRYRFKVKKKEFSGQCIGCKTQDEALAYMLKIKKSEEDKALGLKTSQDRTFTLGDAAKIYIPYSSELASHKDNMRYLKAFINYFGENKLVMSLDQTQIRDYRFFLKNQKVVSAQGKLTDRQKDNKTINLYVGAMNKMINLCVSERKISYNPIAGLEPLKEKAHRTRILFDDEQKRLFDVINEKGFRDLGDTIITRLCTAMRQGEVFGLEWKYIHLDTRTMDIYRQKTNTWTTLYILDPLYKILLERQNNGSKWVFPNPKTGLPYTHMDHSFKTCTELAEFQEYIKQHDLRRTAATWMYEAGIDIHVISIILGHSNIQTTKRYIGIKQGMINNAMKTISSHILVNTHAPSTPPNNPKREKRGKIIQFPFKKKMPLASQKAL